MYVCALYKQHDTCVTKDEYRENVEEWHQGAGKIFAWMKLRCGQGGGKQHQNCRVSISVYFFFTIIFSRLRWSVSREWGNCTSVRTAMSAMPLLWCGERHLTWLVDGNKNTSKIILPTKAFLLLVTLPNVSLLALEYLVVMKPSIKKQQHQPS